MNNKFLDSGVCLDSAEETPMEFRRRITEHLPLRARCSSQNILSNGYPHVLGKKMTRNILFVDKSLNENEQIYKSVNRNTIVVEYDAFNTKRADLTKSVDLIQHYGNLIHKCYSEAKYGEDMIHCDTHTRKYRINRIGFFFSTNANSDIFFVENTTYIDKQNVDWLVNVILKYNVKFLDFFGCNTLIYDNWRNYYDYLLKQTNVTICANTGLTGNPEYGGKWEFEKYDFKMKNGNESDALILSERNPHIDSYVKSTLNMKYIYFNPNIRHYRNTLDSCFYTFMLLTNSGDVYIGGNNSTGMYGNNTTITSTYCVKVSKSTIYPNKTVNAIGAGHRTSYISFTDGTMIASGTQDSSFNFLLNTGYPHPTGSKLFVGCSLTSFSLSAGETVKRMIGHNGPNMWFLTSSGKLFGMGLATLSQFGDSTSTTPHTTGVGVIATSLVPGETIIDIQAGVYSGTPTYSSVYCLMQSGKLYGFGRGELLGIGTIDRARTPVRIDGSNNLILNTGETIKQISISCRHGAVLTSSGRVFLTGLNTDGQFGKPYLATDPSLSWYLMTSMPTVASPYVPAAIATGLNITYILYNNGDLYACGTNDKKQIKSNAIEQYTIPTLVNPPTGKLIKQVQCLGNGDAAGVGTNGGITIILTLDELPYVIGRSPSGTGNGTTLDTITSTFSQMKDTTGTVLTGIKSLNTNYDPINILGSKPTINSITKNAGNSITVNFTQSTKGTDTTTYYGSTDGTTVIGTGVTLASGVFTGNLTISNLTNLSTYSTYVIARNPAGDISSIASTNVSVLGTEPSIGSFNRFTGNSLRINFSQTQKGTDTTTYSIYYGLSGEPFTLATTIPSPTSATSFDSSYVIGSLTKVTNLYAFYITARNPAGDISSILRYWDVLGTKPTISNIQRNRETGSITVFFSQSQKGTDTTTYYGNVDGVRNTSTALTSPNGETSFTGSLIIPDLSNTNTYSIQIDAVNSAGTVQSDSSTVGGFATEAPTITNITKNVENSITVFFSQSGRNINTSTTYYGSIDGINIIPSTGLTSSSGPTNFSGNLTITELTSVSLYNIYVIARIVGGDLSSNASTNVSVLGTKPTISALDPVANSSGTLALTYSQTNPGTNTLTSPVKYYYTTSATGNPRTEMDANPYYIRGLTGTNTYYVFANNLAGDVSSNSFTATPYLLGNKPSISNIASGINALTVTFSSATGGNPSSFTYYYSYDGINRQPDTVTSPFTINGLTSQKTVYIIANNSAGDVSSNPFTSTPYLLGNKPIASVTSGVNKLTISFTNSEGANPVPTYYYSLNGGTLSLVPSNQSPFDISNLTQATSNSVYVLARNAAGDVSSNIVNGTPYIPNGAPTITNITAVRNGLSVEFTGSTGGYPSPTTYYYTIDSESPVNTSSTTSPIVISSLRTVKEYTVRLYAQNLAGLSSASNALTGTPLAGADTEVVTPATYWSLQYWSKPSFWKKSYWSKKRK